MTATLVLTDELERELVQAARGELEIAGVLLARLVEQDGHVRLLARRILWVADAAYVRREANGLTIKSEGYVPALAEAEADRAVPIWFHTHPGLDGVPKPSTHDRKVDRGIADLFRLRADSAYYGTLIMSPRSEGFAFTGALQPDNGDAITITQTWTVGSRLRLTTSYDAKQTPVPGMFDRNVRAFGGDIQRLLGSVHVGIVGCGGTGSAVVEQLVRLGVRQFTLIDPDELSESNVTRVYGSRLSDVGRAKVTVAADNLRAIAPDAKVETLQEMITREDVARRLTACDLVFGCTDDNAGRLVLSRLATYFLVPVFDLGVLISSDAAGQIRDITGRVTTLVPGQACLVCRGRLDPARAAAELMVPEERARLQGEGYAPALQGVEPAVVAFTTAVAAAGVAELLERCVGYGPEPRPSEVLLRLHEREVSPNVASPRQRHYCDPASGKLGLGFTTPFLEQAWPT